MSKRLHVHMQISPKLTPILSEGLTPSEFKAAAKRSPDSCDDLDATFGHDPSQLDAQLTSCEVLIMAGPADLAEIAERGPHLKWIHYTGTGVEGVLLRPPRRGVTITNARGVQTPKAIEYAIAAVLMLNNRFQVFITNQRAARWESLGTTSIAGKTIVILGMGALGSGIAAAMKRLGMRVLGVSRSARPDRSADEVHRPDNLASILPQADFVLVTLPLTGTTRGMIGRAQLDLLPHHAGLVNIGRGPIVDYAVVAEKLRNRELAGAILDVFDEEPLPASSPLWSTPNLIVTPHSSLMDPVSYGPRCFDIFFENLRRYRHGRKLRNIVDAGLGY